MFFFLLYTKLFTLAFTTTVLKMLCCSFKNIGRVSCIKQYQMSKENLFFKDEIP